MVINTLLVKHKELNPHRETCANQIIDYDFPAGRFPEVRMVTGKAGRADTAFDPAPMDMIETMIEFRSHESWPRRRLLRTDARRHAAQVIREMGEAGLVELLEDETKLIDPIVDASLQQMLSVLWQLQFLVVS